MQKRVNKKTGKKVFHHIGYEKIFIAKKSCIAFSMKSFSAQIDCSHHYMMRRWKCLFLVDALFDSSLFFDTESLLLKGIFISHSKNVVTQRNEKADGICLMGTAQFVVWISLLNCFTKI